jgi:hypothetical protein
MSGDRSGPEFERHRRGGGDGTDQSVARRGAHNASRSTTGANSSRKRWTSGLMTTR